MLGATQPTSSPFSAAVWVDLFPWLDDYVSDRAAHLEQLAELSDWWLADSPAVTASETDLETILAALAELFVAHHKSLLLSDAFPKVPAAFPITALDAGPVATTTIHRAVNADTVAPLLRLTAGELFAVRGTGEETVTDVARALLRISVHADPWRGVEIVKAGDDNPALDQLFGDLTALAQWRQLRGLRDRPLLTVVLDDESPAAIQNIANRISAITAEDFPDRSIGDPVAEVERLISTFNEAERTVLECRLLAREPETLSQVALGLHVSKGRVSGIESGMKRKFLAACDFGTAAGTLLASIRMDMRPIAHLDRLVERHPNLAAPVSPFGVPLWFVLDRFDDIFEITGGWAAAPDVAAAKLRTVELLEELAEEAGPASVEELAAVFGTPTVECAAWLQWCGISVHATPDPTQADHEPTAFGLEILPPSVASAVPTDYPIPAPADATSPRPVLSTAPTGTTETTPARRRQRRPASPERTRGLYRTTDGWRYRLVLNLDHLRGSGFAVPGGVAAAIGCVPGATVALHSRLGPQAVRFTGMQPTCGTIRRFLVEFDPDPGDVVFLVFGDDGNFEIQPAPRVTRSSRPLDQALATIGRTTPIFGHAAGIRALAVAISLPDDAAQQQVLDAYRSRSNDPVLPHLELLCAAEDSVG